MMISKSNKYSSVQNMSGFTLIELLVAMAIVSMMMTAVYAFHISSLRAVNDEEERVEIQQDQRISLDFITRQLRVAGYDKLETNAPKIEAARSNYFYYTADLNEDGDVNDTGEHVAFCIYDSAAFGRSLSYITGDSDIGVTGAAGALPISHTHAAGQHEVFAPIEDIEFYYSYYDHGSKSIQQTLNPTATQLEDLRSVAVTILARTDTKNHQWIDNQVYVPASGIAFNGGNAYGDNTRRRMMTANIRFRNMGLD